MSDIIQLLPDSVANQIAAGEVVQRPASVIKELVENAIDAGSTAISVIVKDAGRTLIKVIDNGKGMSETDARMAFERHATSKIRKAEDLFAILTMGFRGEALASMAAVAEVTLQTRREEDEVGVEITVRATDVVSHEPVACSVGANFAVKNLFFNIPARRKFLKSDAHEFRLIVSEVQRVALAFPNIEFRLQHNTLEIFNIQAANFRMRIAQLFGKNIIQGLIDIKSNTTLVKLHGFIGKPELAKKSQGEQFFFVNNRFMKHPYFNKAVLLAYDRLLANDVYPSYFIYLDVDPANIDVNIHPTKTEIKFEDEQAIWQILHATAKEALGKFNVVPSLDFNSEAAIEIPTFSKDAEIRIPTINVNPNFNPFHSENEPKYSRKPASNDYFKQSNSQHWETLYQGFENEPKQVEPEIQHRKLFTEDQNASLPSPTLMQIKGKYILSPAKSGLMIVDQKRAHERILFEQFAQLLSESSRVSQQVLFPQVIELTAEEHHLILEYTELLNRIGFDIRDFGNNSIIVNGCPSEINNPNAQELVSKLVVELQNHPQQTDSFVNDYVAEIMAKATAVPYGKVLSTEEMRDLIDRLFQCSNHNYTPDGKTIMTIIALDEIEKKLK